MGHLAIEKPYLALQERLHKYPIGAPATEELFEILRIRFSEEEAEIAARMPMNPAPLALIGKRFDQAPERLEEKLDRMAEKGLVLDFRTHGKTFYMLAPTVIGFFEFTFMRLHKDLPNKKLADLLSLYMEDAKVANNAFRGETQIGRTIVHEKALPDDLRAEILPYEQTTEILKKAELRAVGRYGREVSAEEALDIAAMTRDNFLVHIGDNVKNKVSYICHCCGCHCGQLRAINHNGIRNAVHTSNFLASVDAEHCKACGRCVKNCPVMAIEVKATSFGAAHAEIDEELCLGCGVCYIACKNNAMSMKAREKRVFTPENNMERLVRAAVERGTIHHMLFDDPDSVTGRGIHLALGALLSLPPAKQLLAIEQIKSTFVKTIVNGAQKRME